MLNSWQMVDFPIVFLDEAAMCTEVGHRRDATSLG